MAGQVQAWPEKDQAVQQAQRPGAAGEIDGMLSVRL